jgi:hypothetical protein
MAIMTKPLQEPIDNVTVLRVDIRERISGLGPSRLGLQSQDKLHERYAHQSLDISHHLAISEEGLCWFIILSFYLFDLTARQDFFNSSA